MKGEWLDCRDTLRSPQKHAVPLRLGKGGSAKKEEAALPTQKGAVGVLHQQGAPPPPPDCPALSSLMRDTRCIDILYACFVTECTRSWDHHSEDVLCSTRAHRESQNTSINCIS